VTAVDLCARAVEVFLSVYHRHEIEIDAEFPETPALVVSNHGFGGVIDLNAMALASALRQLDLHEDVTVLVHQMAWTLGAGPLLELVGARPGSPEAAREAFAAGRHVAVFPGGDVDAAKSWRDRNGICFAGRTGFARIAIEHGVPIVPVVTAGAGETLLVLWDGQLLARALRLPKLLRMKAMPVSVSVPWGLNVGAVGLLPYLPLPSKLHTAVLPPVVAEDGETADELAARVEAAMQHRLTELVHHRIPLLG
jgi:1-acyl-sn-glycerol-3-phosphate acyltransferase